MLRSLMGVEKMREILDEMIGTLNCGIFFPALSTAFLLPDACGAIEFFGSSEVYRSSDRYKRWYDKWVMGKIGFGDILSADVIYKIRNAMMHEVTGFTRGVDGFDRVVFYPPQKYLAINGISLLDRPGDKAVLMIPITLFIETMAAAVKDWIDEVEADDNPRRRESMDKLLQIRPGGFPPNITGVSVIS